MMRDDTVETLRHIYDAWVQRKGAVQGWGHAYGWLVELALVGFVRMIVLGVLLAGAVAAWDSLPSSLQRPRPQSARERA